LKGDRVALLTKQKKCSDYLAADLRITK